MVAIAKKADIALAALLVLASVAFLFFIRTSESGTYAVIRISGSVEAQMDLRQQGSVDITLENGVHVGTARVENGSIFMEWASCPDGICTRHTPVSRAGEVIVCLPNRVVIEVLGDARFDAVSY